MQPLRPKPTGDLQGQPSPIQPRGIELKSRRKNISQACKNCRERRTKCDGRQPACSKCVSLNKTCSYHNSDRRKKEPWVSMINDLQQQNEKLEDIIASLRCNSFPEAVQRLQQLRSSNPSGLDDQSRRLSHSSASSPQQAAMPTSELSTNFSENISEMPSLDMDSHNLPPQLYIRRSVLAFFTCGSMLFYIMPREACEKLLANAYEQPSNMDKCEACALFSIAAVGSLYSTEEIPNTVKKTCFEYAASLLQETTEKNALMAMRASIGLAVCLVLLKSASARTMTASGLNTARWNMRKWIRQSDNPDQLEWARVFRTLAFLECWLSTTLGYTFDLAVEDMSMIEELASSELTDNPFGTISPCLIPSHVYQITLISAQVQSQLQHATSLSRRELDRLSAKLDTWHYQLPQSLQLTSLIAPDSETATSIRRPLLFMHLVHICARIALYERVIQIALSKQPHTSEQAIAREVFWLSDDIQFTLSSFAQALTRIIRLLYDDECILSRCWLTIHSCFHSSLALLLGCTRNLSLRVGDTASTLDDLSKVRDCLLALGYCKDHDIVAMQMSDMVTPLYQRLGHLANDSAPMEEMRSGSQQDGDQDPPAVRTELDSIVCQLVSAMETPFQDLWV